MVLVSNKLTTNIATRGFFFGSLVFNSKLDTFYGGYSKSNDNRDPETKCFAKGGNTAYYWVVHCFNFL